MHVLLTFYTLHPDIINLLMREKLASITAVHGYVPDHVLTNKDLEGMVDTNDEWIVSRTGIKERRILKEPGKATTDMGVEVVKGLLEKSGTSPDEIELLILATVTSDMNFPDGANTICDKCGIKNAFAFDLSAACSGFVFALHTGAQFVKTGAYKKVIVLGIDMMSSIVDYTDRSTCIIFGDGGGGVLLEPNEEGFGIKDAVMGGDGSGRQFLHQKSGGSLSPASAETVANREHFVFQEGRPVFKAAVSGMRQSVEDLLERNKINKDKIDWIVPHQANIRIINTLASMLDFPMDKVMVNIDKYGNTTDGTIPLCLWEYEKKLKKGDTLVLTAFGGGFTWGSILLEWAYTAS